MNAATASATTAAAATAAKVILPRTETVDGVMTHFLLDGTTITEEQLQSMEELPEGFVRLASGYALSKAALAELLKSPEAQAIRKTDAGVRKAEKEATKAAAEAKKALHASSLQEVATELGFSDKEIAHLNQFSIIEKSSMRMVGITFKGVPFNGVIRFYVSHTDKTQAQILSEVEVGKRLALELATKVPGLGKIAKTTADAEPVAISAGSDEAPIEDDGSED